MSSESDSLQFDTGSEPDEYVKDLAYYICGHVTDGESIKESSKEWRYAVQLRNDFWQKPRLCSECSKQCEKYNPDSEFRRKVYRAIQYFLMNNHGAYQVSHETLNLVLKKSVDKTVRHERVEALFKVREEEKKGQKPKDKKKDKDYQNHDWGYVWKIVEKAKSDARANNKTKTGEHISHIFLDLFGGQAAMVGYERWVKESDIENVKMFKSMSSDELKKITKANEKRDNRREGLRSRCDGAIDLYMRDHVKKWIEWKP